MKKSGLTLISALCIGLLLWLCWWSMTPRLLPGTEGPLAEFSVQRAMTHIKAMSAQPHFVGSAAHDEVANYVERELKNLGLQTQRQQGISLTEWGNLVPATNIMARIEGSNPKAKALLLLSHYDSAPHSFSHGASDDASGVAVILEGIRAFLHEKNDHKNDIIILFTDAEELGLNGAATFVTGHPWAKDVGVALNFEARGTAGPGYMLMEVNQGNAAMVDAFNAAGVSNPMTNSLMYSIYKMLPNDTDLTVFREQGKIQGFNFAFIDDHFNYHTQQDDYAHTNRETIAHQGSYLMPLLKHLSGANLAQLNSSSDEVYFGVPYTFLHYPFSWNIPLVVLSAVLLLFILFIGLGKRLLQPVQMLCGFIPLLLALALAGGLTFLGWKLILLIYPEYQDIQQGFTYNGHDYLAAFLLLTVSICFAVYARLKTDLQSAHEFVAPLVFWLLLTLGLVLYLPGAGFFAIPLLLGVVMLGIFVATQKHFTGLNLLLAVPALLLLAPFAAMFPIGLGLKMLAGSAALTVLIFALLLPVFSAFEKKWIWSLVCFAGFLGFLIKAHLNSDFTPGKAKPNSLLYVYNADTDQAQWASYDREPDIWTRTYLGENPQPATALNKLPLFSKYDRKFSFATDAMPREIPEPTIHFLKDSAVGQFRWLKIRITPNRPVHRYDIFAPPSLKIHRLKANGVAHLTQKGSLYERQGSRVLSYYVAQNQPLELEFLINRSTPLNMQLLESSFDLMHSPLFAMQKRPANQMPMPFVMTDAICILKKITPTPVATSAPMRRIFSLPDEVNRDTIPDAEHDELPEIQHAQP